MQRYILSLVLVFTLAACALAQPDPNAPATADRGGRAGGNRNAGQMGGMMMGQNAMSLEVLPDGVFVLRNGTLAKFDATTLAPVGAPLALFGELPARPTLPANPTDQDRAAMRAWMMQNMARMGQPATLANEHQLYIVIGTNFFNVNTKTMTLVKADLAAPAAAGAAARMPMMTGAAQLKLDNGVLYAVIGPEILAVNPADGKVLNRAALPKEMFPAPQVQRNGNAAGRNNREGDAAAPARNNREGGARNAR